MRIKKFDSFVEESKAQDIINFIDFNINESVDIHSIWNKTINKIKDFSYSSKKRVLEHLIVAMLSVTTLPVVSDLINKSNLDEGTKQIATEIVLNSDTTKSNVDTWKKGYEFTLSQEGWDHIKDEEKLKLKAYTIGDGMVTVGYGHAEPLSDSKFKKGDRITKSQADELLKQDLKIAADGVRRIFQEWEEKGIDVKVTQEMFDALVSIAFNSGIGNLRNSELIQDIKRGDFKEAGEKIKTFNVSKKFPGLENRREKESEMFLASL